MKFHAGGERKQDGWGQPLPHAKKKRHEPMPEDDDFQPRDTILETRAPDLRTMLVSLTHREVTLASAPLLHRAFMTCLVVELGRSNKKNPLNHTVNRSHEHREDDVTATGLTHSSAYLHTGVILMYRM